MGKDARHNPFGRPGGPALVGAGGQRILTQPAEVRDAFNRPLAVGDVIDLFLGRPPVFTVQSVERVVETGMPEGLMDVVVVCRLKFRAPRAQPQQEFVRVMTAEETGVARQTPPQEPAEEDPQSDDPPQEDQP